MLKNVELKPITGTFINMLVPDTGITNNGLKEWEQDFQMMKYLGMDQLFIIRTEFEQGGVHLSAEDPRSTTWEEDDNLLDMAFRLGEKYDMSVYLGGPVSITNLHKGDWLKEIDDNKRYYDRTVPKYQHYKCFKGLYASLEALPWHFNFLDIASEVLKYMKRTFPEKKTFISPIINGVLGDYSSHYTPDQWVDIYRRYFYDDNARERYNNCRTNLEVKTLKNSAVKRIETGIYTSIQFSRRQRILHKRKKTGINPAFFHFRFIFEYNRTTDCPSGFLYTNSGSGQTKRRI